mmetsp:Transcript_23012/g.58723  ORF Transcript_23012/g.58723 Transcript_23012/m.58723 type:complete len:519 (-) Transcript_23012:133-1689(-)
MVTRIEVAEVEEEGEEDSARLAIVKAHPPGPPSIRPYCGAKASNAFAVADTRMVDRAVHGMPAPAWADVGMASHMRGLCGLVPAPEPWSGIGRGGAPEVLRPRFNLLRFAFRFGVGTFAVLETVMCYLSYLEVRNPRSHLYNKYEAHAAGMPNLQYVLLGLALTNTLYLFVFWVLVAVVKLNLMKFLAVLRMPLSLATLATCMIVVFYAESTKVFSFLCMLFCQIHAGFLILSLLLPRKEGEVSPWRKKTVCAGLIAVGTLTLVWLLLFLVDTMSFLRDGTCRATKNNAMPVKIEGVDEWQCVKWGEAQARHIDRKPDPSESPYQAQCFTTFHVFDSLNATTPSSGAHLVHCPPQCQTLNLGTQVLGCRVYDARTPICAAAVQMGVLPPDVSGTVKVVGRPPPASGWSSCNLNGVASVSTVASLPLAVQSQGSGNGAFYFQSVSGMEVDDMVTLHGLRQISDPGVERPWESYVADVSWVVGGGEVQWREVLLGPSTDLDVGIEVNFCHESATGVNECP